LRLIASFLTLFFHNVPPVMWQHMQEVAGFLISSLLQIYQGIFQ